MSSIIGSLLGKKRNGSGKAVKAGVGYTVGNILVKGVVFLSIPLFSRIMTTAQFGVYNVFISYESILYVLIGMAMDNSLQSANLDFKNSVNKYISSISLIYIINSIICCLAVTCLGSWLSGVLNLEKRALYLLVIYSFSTAIISLYNMKVSLKYEYKEYLILTLSYSIGNILLSLLLMRTVLSDKRDYGRIVGASGAVLVAALYALYTIYRDAKPRIEKEYWKFALRFSLPLVPHGIAQVLLAQFDRIMIRQLVSDSVAGIYSLATSIKLILTVITTSITTAWRTWFFDAMRKNEIKDIQKRARQLVELFAIFSILMMSFSKEMILIFGGYKYEAGKYVIIPMIMDAFLLFVYSLVVQSEYYAKKTHYIMIGTIIATVINIVTNYVFIQMYGYIAAAYTTLFSYVVYFILHIIISYKVIGFAVVPYKPLAVFLGIVCFDGAINLLLVDNMVLRWCICIVIVLINGIHFVRDMSADVQLKT